MPYRVTFTVEARDQLDHLDAYIAGAADPDIAARFTNGILDQIAKLAEFPRCGMPRDDIRAALRTISWKRRVTIAYFVEEHDVVVAGIYYAGQDYQGLLTEG